MNQSSVYQVGEGDGNLQKSLTTKMCQGSPVFQVGEDVTTTKKVYKHLFVIVSYG